MAQIGGNQLNPNRSPVDYYPTDPRWTKVLLRHVIPQGCIWECAAGGGHMADVLVGEGYDVYSTDLVTGTDFLQQHEPWIGSIITNPPYRFAEAFIHKALELATEQVAMLLPIGFLGGQRRYRDLWTPYPPVFLINVVNRMPDQDGKSSQFNHFWAVWDRKKEQQTTTVWDMAE